MAKCTGTRCPMQAGYKVEECNHTDCPYRTELITNADRIRAMSDEELAKWLNECGCICETCSDSANCIDPYNYQKCVNGVLNWLKQPVKDEPVEDKK